jgi:alpha-glucoside transport system substrate-binding protein
MVRSMRMVVPFFILALVLAACPAGDAATPAGDGESPPAAEEESPPAEEESPPAEESPGAEESPAAGGPQFEEIGGTVSLIGVWADEEEEALMAMLDPFLEQTGITLEYEATRDLGPVLQTRVSGGNPPDVAGLPGASDIRALAEQDALIDLSTVLDMDYINENYAEDWVELGTVDGTYVGLMVFTALKGNIWYNPGVFEENGWEPPETFDDLDALVEEMAETDTPPWGIALESGDASGWPGTDWIEDFVLRQSGPDVYDQWWNGEIDWSSEEIRMAW